MVSLRNIYLLAANRTDRVTTEDFERIIGENEELGYALHMQSYQALSRIKGQSLEGTKYVQVLDNGIAIIDLIGPIFPRSNMMTMSGATSIAQFANDFMKAEANPNVSGIIMNVDSPGGDVRGIGDTAKMIAMLRRGSKKPMKAFASGFMASAAYYISSAVGPNNIISSEMGLVGSIGVVLNVKAKGAEDIEIVSSQSPAKRPDVSTTEGQAPLQQQVNDLADIFINDVRKYRGVSRDKVLSDYGQGSTFVGPRAMQHGLVDKIGTLSQVVEEMVTGFSSGRLRTKAIETANVESMLEFTTEENNTMALKDLITRFRASNDTLIAETEQEQGQVAAVGAESEPPTAAAAAAQEEEEMVQVQGNPDPEPGPTLAQPSREELEERFSEAAELFATQMMMEHRVFPAQAAYAASDLLTARIDDMLIGGSIRFVDDQGQLAEGTREAAVRSRYLAMPKHTMTQKSVAGIREGSIAASVLAETDKENSKDDEPVSPERKKALLAQSHGGQAVLNAQNK